MLRRALQRFKKTGGPQGEGPNESHDDWNDTDESRSFVSRLRRQCTLREGIYRNIWTLRLLLTITGIAWIFVLPLDDLGRSTYMDENAVSPAQTTTHWNWNDVHVADRYLDKLEDLAARNASAEERAGFITTELLALGIPASTSAYAYTSVKPTIEGINSYGIISPPRSSGVESVLVSANWKSLTGSWNLRGIANVMALAEFLRGQNHWARDFVFVFGDDYIEGIEAFLATYHGLAGKNIVTEPLILAPQGVIWAAINIDYPGHSFSHLGLFYEGVNGVLPNQDLLNAVYNVGRYTGGVPVQLHSVSDNLEQVAIPSWLPSVVQEWIKTSAVTRYYRGFRHLSSHFSYAALGRPAGAHGTFAKYRIEGVTLFAEPATGPHGFHALGIIMESTLRAINNLLERFHASFFFYLLPHPGWFHKIGSYLPAAILIGAGMTIEGLQMWIESGWTRGAIVQKGDRLWARRGRKLDLTVRILGIAFLAGLIRLKAQKDVLGGSGIFAMGQISPIASSLPTFPVTLLISYTLAVHVKSEIRAQKADRDAVVLATSSMAHIIGGAVVTALAMINFPQALVLGLGLTFVFAVARPHVNRRGQPPGSSAVRFIRLLSLQCVTPEGLALVARAIGRTPVVEDGWTRLVREWQVLGNWFVPGFLGVWWTLQLVACTLLWL